MSLPEPEALAQCESHSDSCEWPPRPKAKLRLLFSTLPFIFTFSVVFVAVLHRLFPLLGGSGNRHHSPEGRLRRRLSALAFSTALGATAVLAELILCEVSDWLQGDARQLAFHVAVSVLLVCLIVVIPLLEICSLVDSAGWGRRLQTITVSLGFCTWLWIFWISGDWIPIAELEFPTSTWTASKTLNEECLARVGVVGITLMALLSGFGCVSTPWHTFGRKLKPVSDTDISRAQGGLDATYEMLASKRTQLDLLEKEMRDQASREGFLGKVVSSIRTSSAASEQQALRMEVEGLESMAASLSSELNALQSRQTSQKNSGTATGQTLEAAFRVFSVYCIYRVAATSISRLFGLRSSSSSSFSQNDPINNVLALVAKHWDPNLDRAAWSRQISFLLSGVIILGSLSSVLTTVNMLSRSSNLLKTNGSYQSEHGGTNFALFVSQLVAIYVLASALLLRSNLPPEVSSVLTNSLGAPLDPSWVDRWFDGVFLSSVTVTLLVMVVGRKLSNSWEDEDRGLHLEDGLEMGKRC